jgi:PAS domain S-box-containing protein
MTGLRTTALDQLRWVLDVAPDAMAAVDADGRLLLVNSELERLFGYPPGDLSGRPVEVLVPERFRPRHPAHRGAYLRDPRTRPMASGPRLYGRRLDGSQFPAEISLTAADPGGQPLVLLAVRDITDRLQADEQRFRLAAVVESCSEAVVGTAPEGIVTSWNGAAQAMYGYPPEAILGQPLSLLAPPDLAEEDAELLRVVNRGGRVTRRDTRRLHADGHELDVSITMAPVHDGSGALVGAATLTHDITERKRGEAALTAAKEAAESARRELETFSYSVAHDLRAPVRALNGLSRVLLEDADGLDEGARDYLGRIHASAQHMGRLIESLLMLATVTRRDLASQSVDLSALARATVQRLREAEPGRQVRIEIDDGLRVAGDGRLLGIVVENLIGNAWKFTRNTPRAWIRFGCGAPGQAPPGQPGAVFVVRDNGAGFDAASASKLFGAFQRLHTAREFEGTGIGLVTVQRIVQRHGGRVWAHGEVGQGASFHFTLGGVPR